MRGRIDTRHWNMGSKFDSEHGRRISVAVSEDFVIYRKWKPDFVVDFIRAVCVTHDGV